MFIQEYPDKYEAFHLSSENSLLSEVTATHFSYLTERRAVFWTNFEIIFW